MSFMQKEIRKDTYFEIETTEGTAIVPGHVSPRTCATVAEFFAHYVTGNILNPDELIEVKEGWVARMSAPGYLDCTEWGAYPSYDDAYAALEEMYGDN